MIDANKRQRLTDVIGHNLESLRSSRGLSQEQLAEALDVSRAQVNRIEQGHHSPRAELLFAIAEYFGVPVDSLGKISVTSP